MEVNDKIMDMREIAMLIDKLPEKVRERIAYMTEGALLIQEAMNEAEHAETA